eukprot:CAMPEP_0195011968 /NCGR_PEP_ID=MMETSP0326_2-20130528/11421_1 /TAXON_ID=2866 ORGANISM="Crypthecodinium cohnii, Strain Seligo" /NCGR_SAMPLE_ID=MMETSP0326_2 /ASSEMBLY_ACC=CAM_ASM_000348 /LENGTH=92 /DNA_ID=CAMNT_0040021369 /DNA_START=176 /DNA_END=451 /DNA_ORIENTATION=+
MAPDPPSSPRLGHRCCCQYGSQLFGGIERPEADDGGRQPFKRSLLIPLPKNTRKTHRKRVHASRKRARALSALAALSVGWSQQPQQQQQQQQ